MYENYQPCHVDQGRPHPDRIVETASLAAIEPPVPKYEHQIKVCFFYLHKLWCSCAYLLI